MKRITFIMFSFFIGASCSAEPVAPVQQATSDSIQTARRSFGSDQKQNTVGMTKVSVSENATTHPNSDTKSTSTPAANGTIAPDTAIGTATPSVPPLPTDGTPASADSSKPIAEPKTIGKLKSYCKRHPNDWEGFYNLGIEQYRMMDYAAAQQSFANALQRCSDPKNQEMIFYNLGNAGFRFAQSQSADQQVFLFKESLQNYENALALDKEAKDTKHNIEVVKRWLKQAEKQQKQNPKPENKNNKKDQKKEEEKQHSDSGKDNKPLENKDTAPKQKEGADGEEKNVDLEQKEMDNILNRAKKIEKMLPPSSSDPKSGGKDPVIRDW